jgi:hypothetical protein
MTPWNLVHISTFRCHDSSIEELETSGVTVDDWIRESDFGRKRIDSESKGSDNDVYGA